MTPAKRLFLWAVVLCVTSVWAQPSVRTPHIGYLYPGGGQRASTCEILAGGQNLRGVSGVHVTGEGVSASVVHWFRPIRNLNKDQREVLAWRLRDSWEKRWEEAFPDSRVPRLPWAAWNRKASDTNPEEVDLPDHPLTWEIEAKGLDELEHVVHELQNIRKRQINSQIGESVLIAVTIDPNAAPGARELRLRSPTGLTNPMRFEVGLLPEVCEVEPNGPNARSLLPEDPAVNLPVVFNGQIMPGDVDRFRFRAKRGQALVVETQARALVPYLADAVPGWFQATLALYDEWGEEVAFTDDYRFAPDPVLFYEILKTGEYEIEIRDSIYRGREDFVYRISLGEEPFITEMFPLGGPEDKSLAAAIEGWNLEKGRLRLDTEPGLGEIRQAALYKKKFSNEVRYAVDSLPESKDREPNNTAEDAQRIRLPRIVNGRIEEAGDVDVFEFRAHKGDQVAVEVYGRRLDSPLDSLLRLTDDSGEVIAWNDDYMEKEGHLHMGMGLLTHHADSYLVAELPKNGVYRVQVSDAQHHGGDAYAYRLRISPPQPDFSLRVSPPSINVPAGRAVPLSVQVTRKEGFDGAIDLALADAPEGFVLDGGRIPPDRNQIRVTLTAPRDILDEPVALRLEGQAEIGGETVRRTALPVEDTMQAFLYRHLAPSQELVVAVTGRRGPGGGSVKLTGTTPVEIPEGGDARVRVRTGRHPKLEEIELVLSEAPEGVTLSEVTPLTNALGFSLQADGGVAKAGFADNLIVEGFLEVPRRGRDGEKTGETRRVSIGVLPAIPIEIVP